MNFRNWLEQRWYEFKDTVTLYHGTSSALIANLQTEGLKPPEENLEEFALRILKLYKVRPSKPLMEWIHRYSLSLRANSSQHVHRTANVVYLAPKFKEAKGYAVSYYKYGGEMASEIWRAINVHKSKQRKLPKMEPIVPPIYDNAHPVVVEVAVPFQWMKTYHNLEEKYRRALTYWESMKDWYAKHTDDVRTVDDFLNKEISDFEVRVEEAIPPSMIKQIHTLEAPEPRQIRIF